METVFLKVLNMSMTASYVILAVLALRLLLRKAPKKYSYLLWSVVGFRLCCPVSFRSVFSLFRLKPFDMTAAQSGGGGLTYVPENIGLMPRPRVTTGIPVMNAVINDSLPAATPAASVNPMQVVIFVAAALWCAGMGVLLVYALVSYVRLKGRMDTAVRLEGNVWQSERVRSPFILGFVKPKIYIPYGLDENTLRYVLTHEGYHLKRLDHLVKPLAFLLLVLHWFNPLCWLAFYLMGKDMEMSCDEKVLSGEENIRKAYSLSLLSFAANRRFPSPSPLAFGETGVKSRVRNVLGWKKPALWVSIIALILSVAALAACAADPVETTEPADPFGHTYRVAGVSYDAPLYSFTYTAETAPKYQFTSDRQMFRKGLDETAEWFQVGGLTEVELTEENFDALFPDYGEYSGWREELDAAKLRKNNRTAWEFCRDVNFAMSSIPPESYYLLQQEDGTVYLVFWYRQPEYQNSRSHARWVFRLERTDLLTVTVNEFAETVLEPEWYSDYTDVPGLSVEKEGDAILTCTAAVGNKGVLTFALEGAGETLTVQELYYEKVSENDVVIDSTLVELKNNGDNTFTMEVGRRSNIYAEEAVYYVDHDGGRYVFAILFPPAPGQHSRPVENAEQEPETDPLDAAIRQAVLEKELNHDRGAVKCVSYVLLGLVPGERVHPVTGKESGVVTAYTLVHYASYDVSEQGLTDRSGGHIPTVFHFDVGEDGTYTLTGYEQPRDGSYHLKDLERLFGELSREAVEAALDTQRYVVSQIQNCYDQAVRQSGLETYSVIDGLFEKIMAEPDVSSAPMNYLTADHLPIVEYRELIYYRDYTLNYIFDQFLRGGQTGLKGHLMRIIMDDLIGNECLSDKGANGQEYFDAWKEQALELEKEHGLDWMAEKAPAACRMLRHMYD